MGISQEATIRRLVETGRLTAADYSNWRSRFNGVTPPADLGEDGGGGGKSDPIQTKRTIFGSRLLSTLSQAIKLGYLDEIDVFRLVGLKPKYQQKLFEGI